MLKEEVQKEEESVGSASKARMNRRRVVIFSTEGRQVVERKVVVNDRGERSNVFESETSALRNQETRQVIGAQSLTKYLQD